MKRTYNVLAAVAAVAVLGGLGGCTSSGAGAAETKPAEQQTSAPEESPAPVRTAPANADESMCVAITADTDVGDKRLDNAASNVASGDSAAAQGERVLRITEDLEGRLTRYPDARAELKAAVQKVADHYSAAASKLADADAYAAEVVKLRAAQTKMLGMCS
jgi:hypothetical protein